MTNNLRGVAILAVVFFPYWFLSLFRPKISVSLLHPGRGGSQPVFIPVRFWINCFSPKIPLVTNQLLQKRLSKLLIPLWIVITSVLLIDFFALQRAYPLSEIVHSFLGFYPRANVARNIDSPLWYFTFILFYYLIFPLTFIKKFSLLSPVSVLIVSLFLLSLKLPINPDVINLYKLHTLAFPLGMLFGLAQNAIAGIHTNKVVLRMTMVTAAVLVFLYTAAHSGVGEDPKIEQATSLITILSLVAIFSLSKFDFKLLSLFGIYSYEIYLLHWPILSRFNIFLKLPPFLTVVFNLSLILLLGYGLQKVAAKFTQLYRLRARQ